MPRRLSALFVAVALGASLLVVSATRAGASTTEPGAPVHSPLSTWRACGTGLQCAVLRVPVDYTQPGGDHVGIAVIRHRATDRAHRIGSLVVNFGGPGDAGTASLPSYVGELPSEIVRRYDVVSFDPRGTGSSRPVECVGDKISDRLNAVDPTPNDDSELRKFYDGKNYPVDLAAACIAHDGAWLADVGSRNVARDIDQLRAALGDEQLTYVGYSYGTVIGAVYAQMFPGRVGRLVLDSPVNLSANALEELRADGAGFETALDDFLADCAARPKCEFHSRGDPPAALRSLQTQFEGGLTLPTVTAAGKRSARRAGVATFYTALIASLYDKQYGWPELAQALQGAELGNGSALQLIADSYNGRHDDGSYDNINEAIGVILCDDRDDAVPTFGDYVDEYHRDVATFPFLGRYVGSTVLGCDPRLPRPPASETLGDVRVSGTKPVLVVGTTKDPATPYAGAVDLVARIAGARLLTFDSTEHTAYLKSGCIDRAVDAYLVHGRLPPVGKHCTSHS